MMVPTRRLALFAAAASLLLIVFIITKILPTTQHTPTPRASAGATILSATSNCLINTDTNSVTTRKVRMHMTGCAGVQRFQISENPDFSHPSGVTIDVTNVATDTSSADISVIYKDGTTGGGGTPYTLPEKRTVKAFAAIYTFVDADGKDHGRGAYETPLWAKRFVFGDGVIGHEGSYKYNSIKDHILQSTAGRVTLTGETYPTVVRIPLERFRTFLDGSVPSIKDEIIAAIKKEDPTYFDTHQFDYYFLLSSAYYAVDRGYNNLGDHVLDTIPFDKSKSIFAHTIQEVRTAHDSRRVVSRYNAQSVEGVWLAADTARTGTNYFTGGAITWNNARADYNFITLGTPLPSPGAQVIVRYTAEAGHSVDTSTLDKVSTDGWGAHYLHENYHDVSGLRQMQFSRRTLIGDPYLEPALIPSYDPMQNNSLNPAHPTFGKIDGTPLLSAPNKYEMGYVIPRTLAYGGNAANIRLARAELSDTNYIENNTTMIKVPLRKQGDPGVYTKRRDGYYTENGMQSNYANNAAPQYSGEEYLLLEWRSKQPLPDGKYNFDEAIRSEGLIVYHMVETNPYTPSIHGGGDIAENIDATAPYLGGYSNVSISPAAFGPESNTYRLTLNELWQEKPLATSTHQFDFMLSEGRGLKTLYARFVDGAGNVLGTETFTIALDSDETAAQRKATLTVSPISKGFVANDYRFTSSYTAPNGAQALYIYRDGIKVSYTRLSGQTSGSELYTFNESTLTPGTHVFTIEFIDNARAITTQTLTHTVSSSTTTPTPTLIFTGNPTTITAGQSTVLTWSTTNATLCTASGAWAGTKATSGTFSTSPQTTSTYALTCTGAGGNVTKSVTLTVNTTPPPTPAPTLSFNVNTSTITSGGSITLIWSSTDATSCNASSAWTGTKNTSGTESISNLTNSSTFTLTCTGAGGSVTQHINVSVNPVPPPPPTDTTPPVISDITAVVSTAKKLSTTVSWTTNENADSKVIYGTSATTLTKQNANTVFSTAHALTITGLSRRTTYYYQIISKDATGNTATSSVQTFLTR